VLAHHWLKETNEDDSEEEEEEKNNEEGGNNKMSRKMVRITIPQASNRNLRILI